MGHLRLPLARDCSGVGYVSLSRQIEFFPIRSDLRVKVIEEAIQRLVKKGEVVNSGQRKWIDGRYEIVWMLAPTRH
jgi:hypothetical protein